MANSKKEGVKSKKLLYTPVPIVGEKELLLVRECVDCLGPFGLTLWVVSMSMPKNCDTGFPCGMLDNFFFICVSQFLDVHTYRDGSPNGSAQHRLSKVSGLINFFSFLIKMQIIVNNCNCNKFYLKHLNLCIIAK